MILSYAKNIGWFALLAFALTGLGYLLDNDPAYENFNTTLIEFSLIFTFFFVVITIVYFLINRIKRVRPL